MWPILPAIIILGLLGVVGGFYLYKRSRLYIDAKVRWEYETTNAGPAREDQQPYLADTRRPKPWAVVLAGVIVFALLAAAVGLLLDTLAHS